MCLKTLSTVHYLVIFMSNRWVAALVAFLFFVLAFLILYQQEVAFGVWFELSDLHHETFALSSISLGIGVLIGLAITSSNQKQ
jgi:hypothetical protein